MSDLDPQSRGPNRLRQQGITVHPEPEPFPDSNRKASDGSRKPKRQNETSSADALAIQRNVEHLRQVKETFDQRKRQDNSWFYLKTTIGWVAVVIVPAVFAVTVYMIAAKGVALHLKEIAAGALLADVLALGGAVWKIALNPASISRLEPVEGFAPEVSMNSGLTRT